MMRRTTRHDLTLARCSTRPAALRVIEQVERAVELTLGELTLPAAEGGTVSFSECPTCGVSTHRLTDVDRVPSEPANAAAASSSCASPT